MESPIPHWVLSCSDPGPSSQLTTCQYDKDDKNKVANQSYKNWYQQNFVTQAEIKIDVCL